MDAYRLKSNYIKAGLFRAWVIRLHRRDRLPLSKAWDFYSLFIPTGDRIQFERSWTLSNALWGQLD